MRTVTNPTEQQPLQETLRENEHLLDRIAKAMPGILYVYDITEQRNVYINRQIAEILGYSPEAVQAMGANVLSTLTHSDDLLKIAAHHQQFITAKDGEVIEIEYRMRDANGEWHWIISRDLVFARTGDGLVQQILGTAADITRLKQVEEKLRQSEERFRVALKHAPVVVFNQDTELRYTWIYNPILGANVEDIVGRFDAELMTAEDAQRLTAIKRQVLTSGVGARLETSVVLKGDIHYYDLTIEPMRVKHSDPVCASEARGSLAWCDRSQGNRSEDIVGITCVAVDITERRQVEIEILALNAELEQRVAKRTEELRCVNEELRQEIGKCQQIEDVLQTANQDLERYVIELADTNQELETTLAELTASQEEVQKQNQELIATHQALEQERQRYQELFNFAPDAYLVTDIQGNIQEANQAAATLLGVPQTYLVGKPLIGFVIDSDRKTFSTQLLQLKQLQRLQDWEVQLQRGKGSPFFAAITVAIVLDPNGKSVGLRWLIRDISQRKHAEQTIKQRSEWERLLGTITNHIRQSLDLDRILTTTVTEVRQLLQADRVIVFRLCPDGVGRTIAEAVAPGQPTIIEEEFPEETFPDECYEFYRQGNVRIVSEIENDKVATCLIEYFVELGVKSKLVVPLLQDSLVWGVLSVHYCTEPPRQWQDWEIESLQRLASKIAIAIQQGELYQQVQHALAQEKELNELKSRFVSMASHEFRTPLSTILSSADLLEYYAQTGSTDKTSEHIQRIQAACLNMTDLLNDILVIGRSEAGKQEFKPSWLELSKFCGNLVAELQLSVGSKHTLTFVSQSHYVSAYMDEKLLRHILTNLLSNAIKYSPQGESIQFKLFCEDGAAIFQIQDEGIGIPPEDQPHLFESFHRAKNVGTIPGSGLGLAIVKRSVDLHGGKIAIASEIGVGTTVSVTLPLNGCSQTDEEDSGD